jgi:hypothetical protein
VTLPSEFMDQMRSEGLLAFQAGIDAIASARAEKRRLVAMKKWLRHVKRAVNLERKGSRAAYQQRSASAGSGGVVQLLAVRQARASGNLEGCRQARPAGAARPGARRIRGRLDRSRRGAVRVRWSEVADRRLH